MCTQHQCSIQMHYEFLYCGFDQHTYCILSNVSYVAVNTCLKRKDWSSLWASLSTGFTVHAFQPVSAEYSLHAITYVCRIIGASRCADDGAFALWRRYLVLLMFLWGDASWEAQRLGPLGQATNHSGTIQQKPQSQKLLISCP